MDQPAAVGYLIDAMLATGLASCAILLGLAAAIPIAIGYRAGTEAAIRWHVRRGLPDAEAYLLNPELRHLIDHRHQPRKEETP